MKGLIFFITLIVQTMMPLAHAATDNDFFMKDEKPAPAQLKAPEKTLDEIEKEMRNTLDAAKSGADWEEYYRARHEWLLVVGEETRKAYVLDFVKRATTIANALQDGTDELVDAWPADETPEGFERFREEEELHKDVIARFEGELQNEIIGFLEYIGPRAEQFAKNNKRGWRAVKGLGLNMVGGAIAATIAPVITPYWLFTFFLGTAGPLIYRDALAENYTRHKTLKSGRIAHRFAREIARLEARGSSQILDQSSPLYSRLPKSFISAVSSLLGDARKALKKEQKRLLKSGAASSQNCDRLLTDGEPAAVDRNPTQD